MDTLRTLLAHDGWASALLLDMATPLTDAQLEKTLSSDLYGQLSQMVFNAKMRQRVLGTPTLPPIRTATVAGGTT